MLHGSNILGILGSLSKHDALSNRDILDDSIYKKRWMSQLNTNRYYLVNFDFEAEQLSKAVGLQLPSFPAQVRMEGTWNTEDSFLLGLMAPDSHCLNESHGFDACDVGYWLLGFVFQRVPFTCFWCRASERLATVVMFCILL